MEQHVLAWIAQYGYAAIFCLLIMGVVGLPVPDETLLTFAGYLVYSKHLSLGPAYATALTGSLCGISISYTLGRVFGLPLVHRFGRCLHVNEDDVNKAHAWFRRVGHWGLTFGYFIPGVRHLTAYAAGMSALEPQQFALFAYPGGAMWVATFVGLGMLLGDRWHTVEATIHRYLLWVLLAIVAAAAAYILWRRPWAAANTRRES